jgi:hypothetical protein
MFSRNLLRCAVAVAVAIPLYALAGSFNAKPGAWEITMTTLTQGSLIPPEALANMPPERRAQIEKTMQARSGKPITHVRKSCVTQEKLDEDNFIKDDDEGQCKRKIISKSATKLEFERTCPAPHALTMKMIIEVRTPESFAGSMDIVQSGGGKVHGDIKGRWLGASCAGIKDDS